MELEGYYWLSKTLKGLQKSVMDGFLLTRINIQLAKTFCLCSWARTGTGNNLVKNQSIEEKNRKMMCRITLLYPRKQNVNGYYQIFHFTHHDNLDVLYGVIKSFTVPRYDLAVTKTNQSLMLLLYFYILTIGN